MYSKLTLQERRAYHRAKAKAYRAAHKGKSAGAYYRQRLLDNFDAFCLAQLARVTAITQHEYIAPYLICSVRVPRLALSSFELIESRK